MSDLDKLETYLKAMLSGLSVAYEACTDIAMKHKIYGSITAIHETLDTIKDIRDGRY